MKQKPQAGGLDVSKQLPPVTRYLIAASAVAVGLLIYRQATIWIGPGLPPYITFYPAVMIIFLLLGFGPGLLATALSALIAVYLFLPPIGSWKIGSPVDRLSLALFCLTCLAIGVIARRYERNRQKAAVCVSELALFESQRSLHEYQQRLAAIFESTEDAIIAKNLEGIIIAWNRGAERVFGYTSEEAIGKPITMIIPDDKLPDEQFVMERIKTGERVEHFETRRLSKGGTLVDVSVSVSPLRDRDGTIFGASKIARDITERKAAESALKASEERWKFALEVAGDGLWDWNVATDCVYYSRQWKAMLGYSEDEVGNAPDEWDRRVHPNDRQSVYADLERHLRGEAGIYTHEYRLLCKDGRYKWVLDRGKVISRAEDGTARRVIGTLSDITGRKRMELYRGLEQEILKVLNEQESQFEAIKRVIPIIRKTASVEAVGIRLQDNDDFPYFYQEGFTADFLLKENSLLARARDGGICRNECGDICLECTCGLVIEGKIDISSPLWTSGGSCWTNNSFPLLHLPAEDDPRTNPRNECIHQGFASVALIPIKAKGRVVGLMQLNDHEQGRFMLEDIQALEDIAENIGEAMLRKQAEEKLSVSQRFLLMLTDQLPGMVGYWTSDLRCTFANRAYEEWFGKTPDRVVGMSMPELMGEELFSLNEPYVRKTLRGEAQRFERTLIKANGEPGHMWAHYVPDIVDGTVKGMYVLLTDVTDLRKAEDDKSKLKAQLQQAQKMESVGRLAGGVAHDFNNQLTVIIGHCELGLLYPSLPEPVIDNLTEIRKAAERSADLTQQLLAFARKQTIAPKVLNLNDTVENVLRMLRRLIGEDIKLAWQPTKDLWQVEMDPSQVDQILANLCVNARDAIDGVGKITIETAKAVFDDDYCANHLGYLPGDYVMLAVSDDGCGMDRETVKHVFEPFFTTKDVGMGTGLGLATVYGIVRQNNGFVNVYSEPGRGTTFRIYVPRYDRSGEQGQPEATGTQLSRGQETILLVEDDASILKLTTQLLQRQGYNVVAAGSPGEAIECARVNPGRIDLVMTDVVMPGMNGKELAKELASFCPKLKCLFTSGYTANVIAHHGVLDPDVQFIPKPFSLPDLAAKVREVLDT